MLRTFKADLHIHTCLSPCAEVKMSPAGIIDRAKAVDLDILGICDHNSAENTPAAMEAAQRHGLYVLPGMEITSMEEVHLLALFDALEPVHVLQEIVYEHLPGKNDEKVFGMQVVAGADDEVLGFNQKLLIGATTLQLTEIVEAVHSLGGIAVAAHIDRQSFGIIGQLGFIPKGLALDALEISARISKERAIDKYGSGLPYVQSSDAHRQEEIGRCHTMFSIGDVNIQEIQKALKGIDGRRIMR
ncbi:MAG: PHP domain-containing protein [Deltaproteobacteria bacterium]|nr:PHP domain-containing protein [Deltaproteobacteria bacterium]